MNRRRWSLQSPVILLFGVMATYGTPSGAPADMTAMSREGFEHARQVMALYPPAQRPGVDLAWHMDRAIEYLTSILDREHDGMPYFYQRVYQGPARMLHDMHWHWDAPHGVARSLHGMMVWEEATGRRVADQEAIDLWRSLLHRCISPEDHRAHYLNPLTFAMEGVDGHSQRETLLALVGLAKARGDREAEGLARRLVAGTAAVAHLPDHGPHPTWSGRMIRALLDYHRLTGDSVGLELAQQFADEMNETVFDDTGKFPSPAHNHSILGTMTGLIDLGFYTNQARYVDRMKRIIDDGVWKVRSDYGIVLTEATPPGEGNCSADVVQAEILLGLHGYPEYFDDVERIIRNHLLASQYLDPTITVGPSAAQAGVADNRVELFTGAARRACGGFTFTMPNDLICPINDQGFNGEFDLPSDTAGAVLDGLAEAWRAIVTRDQAGLRVNLLFSKETPELDIRSYIPARGRVELDIKQLTDVYVRIPGYVSLEDLSATVNGEELPKRMFGPYLLIPKQSGPATVVIEFEQVSTIEEETICGVTYREEWLGDTVWNITPAGERVPIYTPARLALYGVTPD